MNKFFLPLIFACSILFFACNSGNNKTNEAGGQAQVSEARPKATVVTFQDESGKTVSLNSLKGKVVFINFWATWCPPCKEELPSINKLRASFKDNKEIVFLMVDVNEPLTTAKSYMSKNDYDLPVFSPVGDMPPEFLGNAIPTTVILNKDGKMTKHIVGAHDYAAPQMKQLLDSLITQQG